MVLLSELKINGAVKDDNGLQSFPHRRKTSLDLKIRKRERPNKID
jgi:hypothetical protein